MHTERNKKLRGAGDVIFVVMISVRSCPMLPAHMNLHSKASKTALGMEDKDPALYLSVWKSACLLRENQPKYVSLMDRKAVSSDEGLQLPHTEFSLAISARSILLLEGQCAVFKRVSFLKCDIESVCWEEHKKVSAALSDSVCGKWKLSVWNRGCYVRTGCPGCFHYKGKTRDCGSFVGRDTHSPAFQSCTHGV